MARAMKVCSCLGCAAHRGTCVEIVSSGRCARCGKVAELARGTASQRGYDQVHQSVFRRGVLQQHPLCQCADAHSKHCAGQAPSTVADHWPRSRRELVRLKLNPNDPRYGRGLCAPCHNWHTSQAQPGGWAAR